MELIEGHLFDAFSSREPVPPSLENALEKGGTARRDKTLAAPCRFIKILAWKCGFVGQRSDEMTLATRAESAMRTRF
jgi:hypothetical protein